MTVSMLIRTIAEQAGFVKYSVIKSGKGCFILYGRCFNDFKIKVIRTLNSSVGRYTDITFELKSLPNNFSYYSTMRRFDDTMEMMENLYSIASNLGDTSGLDCKFCKQLTSQNSVRSFMSLSH